MDFRSHPEAKPKDLLLEDPQKQILRFAQDDGESTAPPAA
jgi:hypothetical protein